MYAEPVEGGLGKGEGSGGGLFARHFTAPPSEWKDAPQGSLARNTYEWIASKQVPVAATPTPATAPQGSLARNTYEPTIWIASKQVPVAATPTPATAPQQVPQAVYTINRPSPQQNAPVPTTSPATVPAKTSAPPTLAPPAGVGLIASSLLVGIKVHPLAGVALFLYGLKAGSGANK